MFLDTVAWGAVCIQDARSSSNGRVLVDLAESTGGQGKPTMKIVIDEHRCQAHGRCYAIAPEVFEPVDDDGHSGVLLDELPANDTDLLATVAEAGANCPEHAITVDESECQS